MGSSREFLNRHPEIEQMRDRSQTWSQVKDQKRMKGLDGDLYVVRGDTMGDEDDLLVDTLARGGAPQTSDPMARSLFEELSPEMQKSVRSELLKINDKGEPL